MKTFLRSVSFGRLLLSANLRAQTWNGGTGNWNNAGMWTPGTVPNSTSAIVFIDSNSSVTSNVTVIGAFN